MKRQFAHVAAVVLGLMTITQEAQAKFAVRLVIDGPGLPRPLELPNTSVRVGCTFARYCHPLADPPGGSLGPRFVVTQWLEGHHADGPMMDRIVHAFYPYASERPVIFTASGQTWHDWNRTRRVKGGWTPAPSQLTDALRSEGLSEQPPPVRLRSSALEASSTNTGADIRRAWTLMLLVSLAVLIVGGALLPRRRGQWLRRQD